MTLKCCVLLSCSLRMIVCHEMVLILWFRFHGDIHMFKNVLGIIDTVHGVKNSNSLYVFRKSKLGKSGAQIRYNSLARKNWG